MVSLAIIKYRGVDLQSDVLFLIKGGKNKRLTGLNLTPNSFNHIYVDYYSVKSVRDAICFVKNSKIKEIVCCISADPLFMHLSHYFKGTATITSVAPDGMAAFVTLKVPLYGSYIKQTLNYYRYSFKNKLWPVQLRPVLNGFGRNGYVTRIYTFSQFMPYKVETAEVCAFTFSLSKNNLDTVRRLFDYNSAKYAFSDAVIIIANTRPEGLKAEIAYARYLAEKHDKPHIICKLKPHAGELIDVVSSDITIIDEHFPAELMIADARNCIFVSEYSTAMLYKNHSCHYFWLYPYMQQLGLLTTKKIYHNPTTHIKTIQTFPNKECMPA